MTQTRNLICFRCKNWIDFKGCPAFPEGIPEEILETNEHSEIIEGQIGNFIFTPIDKDELLT